MARPCSEEVDAVRLGEEHSHDLLDEVGVDLGVDRGLHIFDGGRGGAAALIRHWGADGYRPTIEDQ